MIKLSPLRLRARNVFDHADGASSTPLAAPSLGAKEVSVVHQRYRPGHSNKPHYHNTEEIVIVLKGMLAVEAQGASLELNAGDSLVVPAETTHRFEAGPGNEAEWLIIAPADREFIAPDGRQVPSPPWTQ